MLFQKSFSSVLYLFFLFTITNGNQTSFAQNDTERGGGDSIVEEFRAIERTVLSNIKNWRKDDVLKITKLQHKNLLRTAQILEVYSEDRVYLKEYEDGFPPEKEVDAVNYKFSNPPKIVLGRKRWKEKDSCIEKETLVLHELLSVSKIKDKNFEKSYLLKLNYHEKLNEFKLKQQQILHELNQIDSDLLSSELSKFINYIMFTTVTSEYYICINTKDKTFAEQISACTPLLDLISKTNSNSFKVQFDESFNRIAKRKIDLLKKYSIYLQNQPTAWQAWSKNQLETYNDEFETNKNKLIALLKISNHPFLGSPGNPFITVDCINEYYNFMSKQFQAKNDSALNYTSAALDSVISKLESEIKSKK